MSCCGFAFKCQYHVSSLSLARRLICVSSVRLRTLNSDTGERRRPSVTWSSCGNKTLKMYTHSHSSSLPTRWWIRTRPNRILSLSRHTQVLRPMGLISASKSPDNSGAPVLGGCCTSHIDCMNTCGDFPELILRQVE